jgi:predicted phage gp36 major capsid-like protein
MLQKAMQQGMQGMQPPAGMEGMQLSPEQRQKMQQEFMQRLEEAKKNNPPPK